MIGTTLAHYRITAALGAGGMGEVWRAEDTKLGRQVAIKVFKPEVAEQLGEERFLLEIETAASLNHPHILPLLDSGEAEGQVSEMGKAREPVCWIQTGYASGYASYCLGKSVFFIERTCRARSFHATSNTSTYTRNLLDALPIFYPP